MMLSRRAVLSGAALGGASLLLPQGSVLAQRANPLASAQSWAFQLDNIYPETISKIAGSQYDLIVTDMEKSRADGTPHDYLSRAEIERLKRKPDGGRRLVIGYLSIGEAENNRAYWEKAWNSRRPSWIKKENKDWKGDFVVEYWQPAWQSIVFGTTNSVADSMLEQGFDGFYFDIVDAYYAFGDTHEMRRRMVDFVARLSKYLREKKPDVAILCQNAEELVDYPGYLPAIDGIAKESLFYGIKGPDILNRRDDIEPSTALLKKAVAAGKRIFAIEYLSQVATYNDAVRRHREMGNVLYIGPRGLADLNLSNGPVSRQAATLRGAAHAAELEAGRSKGTPKKK